MNINLKKIVDDILKVNYDYEIPLKIKNRCKEELKEIKENKEDLNYFLAYKICSEANDDGHIIIDRVAGSFLLLIMFTIAQHNAIMYVQV